MIVSSKRLRNENLHPRSPRRQRQQSFGSMAGDLYLSIDVGTGSVRAALVDGGGEILLVASREYEQIVPAFGWAEQRAEDWWHGVVAAIRKALDACPEAEPPDRRDLRLRPDARHRARRRGRPADARHRAAVERQANGRAGRGVRGAPIGPRPISPRAAIRRRRPGPASSCLAARQRPGGLSARGHRDHAEGLHQSPADRRGRHRLDRCVLELPDESGGARTGPTS